MHAPGDRPHPKALDAARHATVVPLDRQRDAP